MPNIPQRRKTLAALALGLLALKPALAAPARPKIEIWKSPTCGCCHDWMDYMVKNGFEIGVVHDSGNDAARNRLGIPTALGSCHTALIDGYAFEGHVPAREVYRVLAERPEAAGLTVPGMPIGSPGMDGPEYRGKKDPYNVLLVLKNGQSRVYQRYA